MRPKDPLSEAVLFLRTGDHAEAEKSVDRVVAREPPSLELELKAATIRAEIADHDGYYKRAVKLLEDFLWVSADLKDSRHQAKSAFQKSEKNDEWWMLRQKLFYQWQRSVAFYRAGDFLESRTLLRTALEIAKKLEPRAEGLLTQLYFGTAKIELQRGNYDDAARFFRESIVNAAAGPATAKEERATVEEVQLEEAAAQYSIGKAMALGLGQCLREQGRLEEAYPIVVAGVLLLERSGDLSLIRHAQQTLASIERGTAGEREQRLLRSARKRLEECVDFFKEPRRDEFFRSRYELALVYMQQGFLQEARDLMQLVRTNAEGAEDIDRRPKWLANASIGLSRIERRDNKFELAIEAAEEALREAGNEQKKIARRARGTLARARAAAAIDRPTQDSLEHAKGEIEECLSGLQKDDVRNRLTLDLWRALVLNAMGQETEAKRALGDYEKNAAGVDVGRIKEFAEQVTAQVRRSTSGIGLPIEHGDYRLRVNMKALKRELVRKVATIKHKTERAKAMGVSRIYYLELEATLLDDEPTSTDQFGGGGGS